MILVIDTATSRALLALGSAGDPPRLVATRTWPVGHRHGETLLATLATLLAEQETRLLDLTGIVVGTGPGAFTGLRVGLATAKGLAHALGLPLAGVSTAEALLAAAGATGAAGGNGHGPSGAPGGIVLLLPAGPNDRILVRPGEPPRLLPGGTEPDIALDEALVAIDLAEGDRAPAAALELGERLRGEALATALLGLGVPRLGAAESDDLARLVPEYVTLPRGVMATSGEVTWSRDPR